VYFLNYSPRNLNNLDWLGSNHPAFNHHETDQSDSPLADRLASPHGRRIGSVVATLAEPRSIISLVLLSAGLGSALDVEASGVDEHEAVQAIEEFFRVPGGTESQLGPPPAP